MPLLGNNEVKSWGLCAMWLGKGLVFLVLGGLSSVWELWDWNRMCQIFFFLSI